MNLLFFRVFIFATFCFVFVLFGSYYETAHFRVLDGLTTPQRPCDNSLLESIIDEHDAKIKEYKRKLEKVKNGQIITNNTRYACAAGQGKAGAHYAQSNRNNEVDCWNTCSVDHECIAFDFTISSISISCRLYKVDEGRSSPGGDNRMYCRRTPDNSVLQTKLTWDQYLSIQNFDKENFIRKNNREVGPHYPNLASQVELYLRHLANFMKLQSQNSIIVDKRPQELPEPKCNDTYFNEKRENPAKIVDFIIFGYELDLLEIRLFELYDVVDEFVIWESIYSHRANLKPLIFEMNKDRFQRFSKKIIHFIQDDSEIHNLKVSPQETLPEGTIWANEAPPRESLKRKWLNYHKFNISNSTLILAGDVDELPPAEAILNFKYCKTPGIPAAFHTTMYTFHFEQVKHLQDGYGFWTQPMITTIEGPFRHIRKHMVPQNFAGAHMNRVQDPITLMFKMLCLAEEGRVLHPFDLEKNFWEERCKSEHIYDISPISQWKKTKWIPWFAKENPERFPYMFPSKNQEWSSTQHCSQFEGEFA